MIYLFQLILLTETSISSTAGASKLRLTVMAKNILTHLLVTSALGIPSITNHCFS